MGIPEVDLESFAAGDFEAAGVEAELVQHGGVDVGDVVPVLDGVEAELVGGAVDDAPLDAAAGQPDGEAVGVVVAAVVALGAGVRPNSVAQTTRVSSSRPRCLRSLSRPAIGWSTWAQLAAWFCRRPVGVPGAGAAVGAVEDLHEADAALDQPARGQAHLAEGAGDVVVQAVELGVLPARLRS